MERGRPRIGITLGDPRGIGPEVTLAALADTGIDGSADFLLIGAESADARWPHEAIGRWEPGGGDREAGLLSARAIERAAELAATGEIDGIVTAPISKRALAAAGYEHPGHTELLRDLAGVPDVTMMMAAETTPLGGPLRLALLTAHVPLRDVPGLLTAELVVRRSTIAARALREWWGFENPRVCFAGLNPHASEEGLFGDEEARVLEPAAAAFAASEQVRVAGVVPADTAFRRCIEVEVDLVVTPYHDVGLAVLKTLALEEGVNVTAGLPYHRTSPDHGTAFDIAGTGRAHPGAMIAAIRLCGRFCARGAVPA